MFIDIQTLLSDKDIYYATSGKNIGTDWIGVICPKCGDTRNHCGINPSGTGWSCFACGNKGNIQSFLSITLKVSFNEVTEIINEYADKYYVDKKTPKNKVPDIVLPGDDIIPSLHRDYLTSRGYDTEFLMKNYGVQFEYQTGDFRYRLIIPIYFNNEIVTFVGRDVTGESALRYKYQKNSEAKLNIGQVIYNWDNIQDEAILVEGIFDQWTMGNDTAAVMGIVMTPAQIRILKRLKRAWILFDRGKDAQKRAQHLLSVLSFCGVQCWNTQVPSNVDDPGEMTQKQVVEYKKEIGII